MSSFLSHVDHHHHHYSKNSSHGKRKSAKGKRKSKYKAVERETNDEEEESEHGDKEHDHLLERLEYELESDVSELSSELSFFQSSTGEDENIGNNQDQALPPPPATVLYNANPYFAPVESYGQYHPTAFHKHHSYDSPSHWMLPPRVPEFRFSPDNTQIANATTNARLHQLMIYQKQISNWTAGREKMQSATTQHMK